MIACQILITGLIPCLSHQRPELTRAAGAIPLRRYSSERADREIAQPKVGEASLFPELKQRPVQALPQEIVAAFDRNADALAEEPALQKRPAAESTAARRIGAVEPEGKRDAVVEQKVDF